MSHPRSNRPVHRLVAIVGLMVATIAGLLSGATPVAAHAGHLASGEQGSLDESLTTDRNLTGEAPADAMVFTGGEPDDEQVFTGGDDGRGTGPRALTHRGGVAGVDVECLVDFDDDLVLQYSIPDAAENTFMNAPWFQACSDLHYYPAMAVKPLDYGHFHLGYQDPRIGPCAGSTVDWGRHEDPAPAPDDPDFLDWTWEPCVEDIDPATEPRTGIMPHLVGHRGQIYAYDDNGHFPFRLETIQVVGGSIELCHLPPGEWEAAFPGGSPWQCTTLGDGYWDMSAVVDNAIEVRFEFLEVGTLVDNIGIDLLDN